MNYPDCIAGVNIYGAKSEQYQRLEVTVIQRAIVEDDAAPCGFVVATKKPISDEMVKRYLRYILAVITGHRSGSCGNALKVMGLASKPCLECFNTESKVNVHSESVR